MWIFTHFFLFDHSPIITGKVENSLNGSSWVSFLFLKPGMWEESRQQSISREWWRWSWRHWQSHWHETSSHLAGGEAQSHPRAEDGDAGMSSWDCWWWPWGQQHTGRSSDCWTHFSLSYVQLRLYNSVVERKCWKEALNQVDDFSIQLILRIDSYY